MKAKNATNIHITRFLYLLPHPSIDFREHPAVEVLEVLAVMRECGAILRVLLLPDLCLLFVFLAIFLRMIAHMLNVVRHPLRGFDHLTVARRTF